MSSKPKPTPQNLTNRINYLLGLQEEANEALDRRPLAFEDAEYWSLRLDAINCQIQALTAALPSSGRRS